MARRADGPPGAQESHEASILGVETRPGVSVDPQNGSRQSSRVWRLEFEGMPPGPNDLKRLAVARRMGSAKKWRELADIACVLWRVPKGLSRIRLSAVFRRRAMNVADYDNDVGRVKNLLDGIVRYGVVPNDTRRYVTWGNVTEERGAPGVTLVIEEVG